MTRGDVQNKVVLLAERSAQDPTPPPSPNLNGVFFQKVPLFLQAREPIYRPDNRLKPKKKVVFLGQKLA